MAFDEELAVRVRTLLEQHPGVTEKAMFGGLAFLVDGAMAVSVSGQGGLLLRVDPSTTDVVVREAGVTRFEMRGRQLDGWVHVAPSAISSDEQLEHWVTIGVARAEALPPK